MKILNWIMQNKQLLLNLLVLVIGVARIIVILTPSPVDDGWLAKALDWLAKIGLVVPTAKTDAIRHARMTNPNRRKR